MGDMKSDKLVEFRFARRYATGLKFHGDSVTKHVKGDGEQDKSMKDRP